MALNVAELVTSTDDSGRRIIGSPAHGCRFYGRYHRTESADGRVVVYMPTSECCMDALRVVINRRRDEIDGLKLALTTHDTPGLRRRIVEAYEELDGLKAKLSVLEALN